MFTSYYFPPYNTIAAQRAAKIAKTLLDKNYSLTIFTIDLADIPENKIDLDFNKDLFIYPNLTIIRVPISKFGYEDSSKAFFVKKVYSNLLTKLFCSNGIFWYKNLKKSLFIFFKSNKVNYLFFTGSPFITFLIAYKLNIKFKCKYILDYRDLWTQNPRTSNFKFSRYLINRLVEKKIINNAKAIITVSNGCAQSLGTLIKNVETKVFICRNLPSTDYLKYFDNIVNNTLIYNSRNKFRLVIVGTVYKNCTLTPILDALNKIDKKLLDDKLLILYYGQSGSLLKNEIESFGFKKYYTDYGFVSKNESIRAILSSDLLVSLVDDGKSKLDSSITGLMTTKIFDYFLAKIPIINIAPDNSDINNFALEIKHSGFYTFNADKIDSISIFLENQIRFSHLNSKPSIQEKFPLFDFEFANVINNIFE